jgi:hypothetical protein
MAFGLFINVRVQKCFTVTIDFIYFIEQDLWIGLLHHTVNEHKWVLGDGKGKGKCGHGDLTEAERQKPWLSKNSKAHDALRQIVMKKRFMNTIPYYVNFR